MKRVQGHPGVWELSFAPDGRATFAYGEQRTPGQRMTVTSAVRWRRRD